MVQEGIILGHRVSKRGIEMDKVKIEIIDRLAPPTSAKSIRSFLGHAWFYRRFFKNFSKIANPLYMLLEHDRPFKFNDDCLNTFCELKKTLITTLVIVPNWSLHFELMCDASDHSVRVLLGQRKNKIFTSFIMLVKPLLMLRSIIPLLKRSC